MTLVREMLTHLWGHGSAESHAEKCVRGAFSPFCLHSGAQRGLSHL